ncbi:uncharacterized protein EV420DRAFT_1531768 [Desarmillaria tabescens]|uniref:Uncharacterized protein n=1 Tax=Armillaria tabescens TaxID=1929756 RepID=A0AA39N980_ARMTA|nr:uncharacterized protein EV420DRAFT_1531768 [Desarmillaria tabescens]KAK0461380.1 hypothetical protein EV420DRAFT_1531768 [Desarmillaria tabescens]
MFSLQILSVLSIFANNRLQAGTYQFYSDCNSQTYCASNSTCAHKGCRKDEFPFGYTDPDTMPPKCPRGQFCPDEQDQCLDVLPVGSPCQLNRDDQCEGPPNFKELADESNIGLNVNGSVCLNNICMWANVTEGEACVVENTAYIAYGTYQEYIDIVSRLNKDLGVIIKLFVVSFLNPHRCSTYNCLSSGVCGESPRTPRHFGAWVYVIVCIGMFGTLFGLFFLHRSQREQEREKRMQYWKEQNAFHQSLAQMRETARNSIMSLGNSTRSTILYDESPAHRRDDGRF